MYLLHSLEDSAWMNVFNTASSVADPTGLTHKRNSRWAWWLMFSLQADRKKDLHVLFFYVAASESSSASHRKKGFLFTIIAFKKKICWIGTFKKCFGTCRLQRRNLSLKVQSRIFWKGQGIAIWDSAIDNWWVGSFAVVHEAIEVIFPPPAFSWQTTC